MSFSGILAALSVISLVLGSPAEEEDALITTLCGGGTISIPIGDDSEQEAPCAAKACHAVNCRKPFDPDQRRKGDRPPSR